MHKMLAIVLAGGEGARLKPLTATRCKPAVGFGSTVDVHAADQLPVFLALAGGRSEFRISRVSSHASTVMWLVELLTSARCGTAPAGDATLVHVLPSA